MSRDSGPLAWVRLLCEEVGPRRPAGEREARAATLVAERLRRRGCQVDVQGFGGYSTFAAPYGVGLGLSLVAALVPPRRPLARAIAALLGPAAIASEDGLLFRPLSRLLSRRASSNLVVTVEPRESPRRTICLVCHLDTSRSGLIFHPGFLPWLHRWIGLQAAALAAIAATPLLERAPAGRALLVSARAVAAAALLLLAERELRGVDVPGANDNASGVATVATLLSELSRDPPRRTRVLGLFTGCEEAGVLGADAFVRSLERREAPGGMGVGWRRWLFLNFDGVGAPATLRYLRREGVLRKWSADRALIEVAGGIARKRPELALAGTDHNAGLTYDVTPVLARGGRAITFSAQDAVIPNYHAPTDTVENLDSDVLERAVEVGRQMVLAIDGGAADD